MSDRLPAHGTLDLGIHDEASVGSSALVVPEEAVWIWRALATEIHELMVKHRGRQVADSYPPVVTTAIRMLETGIAAIDVPRQDGGYAVVRSG